MIAWALLLGPSTGVLALAERAAPRSGFLLPISWTLGPWIWVGVAAVLRLTGLDLLASAVAALVPFAVLSVAFFRRRTVEAIARGIPGGSIGWAVAASLAILGAFFVLRNGETSLWDSEYHARIATYLGGVSLPPENPFLAGRPLVYPWLYHLEIAAIGSLTGLMPYDIFPIFDLHAIAGLALALALCLPPPTRGTRAGGLAVLLGIWAPNSIGWLFHVARWTTGEVRGLDAVRQSASSFDQVLSQMAPGFARSVAFPAHKFFEGTPYVGAVALLFLAISLAGRILRGAGSSRDAMEGGPPTGSPPGREDSSGASRSTQLPWFELAVLTLVIATWLHVHFMSALLLLPPLAMTAVVAAALQPRGDPRRARRLALLSASAALAVALSWPYLSVTLVHSLRLGGGRLFGFGPRPENLLALPAVALPYGLIALLGRRGAPRRREEPAGADRSGVALPHRWVAGVSATMLVCGAILALADHNEEKILIPGAMLVPVIASPFAARALSRQAPRIVRAVAMSFVVIASTGILLVVALAAAWRPAPQYRCDEAVTAALDRLAPPGAVIVSDSFAPLPQTRPGYLYFPEIQAMWGFIEDLEDREGVIAVLKGAPPRRPLGLPVVREGFGSRPDPHTLEKAIGELQELRDGAVLVVPARAWPPLSTEGTARLGLRALPSVAGWDLFRVPPSSADGR